jgi:hypothetical protein
MAAWESGGTKAAAYAAEADAGIAAILLGGGIALILHFIRQETPGASWIRSATKK